ncbi:guanine nucleotide-binding protein subunit beta [[Candida] anglica]|uniref:Guanine nucleotide-binding protein subunit beta n=1 Tax=[Candida] anglica TaxID=148631 RepID=A0ABP0EJJ6_9ASCO
MTFDALVTEKNTARSLYKEIESVRKRTNDIDLTSAAIDVSPLPDHRLSLRNHDTLKGHIDKVVDIDWSSDSSRLLSGSQDGLMLLWDPVSGYKKHVIPLQNQWILTCAYSPKRNYIASAGLDNACTIHRVHKDPEYGESFSTSSVFKGHTAYISACQFLSDDCIVTGSGDMTCALWDCKRATKSRDFVDHLGDILCLSTNVESQMNPNIFVSGAADGYARVWDVRQQPSSQSFYTSGTDINCIRMFPMGHTFAAGSDDGVIRLYDMRADCQISTFSLHDEMKAFASQSQVYRETQGNSFGGSPERSSINTSYSSLYSPGVNSLDFSRSGRILFSCYADYGCVMWDVLKCEAVGMLGGHQSKISQVRSSPDGMAIATASWDSTIKIWAV